MRTILLLAFTGMVIAQSSSNLSGTSISTTTSLDQSYPATLVIGVTSLATSQPALSTGQPSTVTSQAGNSAVMYNSSTVVIASVLSTFTISFGGLNITQFNSSSTGAKYSASRSSGTASAASGASSAATTGAAMVIKPLVGLGAAGALFAVLL